MTRKKKLKESQSSALERVYYLKQIYKLLLEHMGKSEKILT